MKKDSVSKFFVVMDDELVIFDLTNNEWQVRERLQGTKPQAVAIDLFRSNKVYCGTFQQGLLVSDDFGNNWRNINSETTSSAAITSLVTSPNEKKGEFGVLYFGTEPSKMYRSEDRGETWENLSHLERLPSAKTWSFPPKPYTHHVRTIVCDPNKTGLIYAAIDATPLLRNCGSVTINQIPCSQKSLF